MANPYANADYYNIAEGGSDGTAVTSGNSGGTSGDPFDQIVNLGTGTCEYEATSPAEGSLFYKIRPTGGAITLTWTSTTLGTLGAHAGVMYFRWPTATPATGTKIVLAQQTNGGSQAYDFICFSSGTVRMRDSAEGTLESITGQVSTGNWYRLEWQVTHSTGAWAFQLYAQHGTTPLGQFSGTGASLGTQTQQLNFGRSTGVDVDIDVDAIGINATNATALGPAVASDNATFDLTITHATDSAATADRTYVIDASDSTGAVTLTQTSGTTVSDTESPTGVFTFDDPGGTDALVFDLDAGTDTIEITITRAQASQPAILTFTGGTVTDIANWG